MPELPEEAVRAALMVGKPDHITEAEWWAIHVSSDDFEAMRQSLAAALPAIGEWLAGEVQRAADEHEITYQGPDDDEDNDDWQHAVEFGTRYGSWVIRRLTGAEEAGRGE